MALHAVAAKYDPSRGVRLFSYAGWAVRVALEEAVRCFFFESKLRVLVLRGF